MRERLYPIDNISLLLKSNNRISENFAELYGKGWSLRDIAREYGCCKTKVRSSLIKSGLKLRERTIQATHIRKASLGKQGARLFYGFAYLDGEIVKDPREFPTLRKIHRLWEKGRSVPEITRELNQANIPSRRGGVWKRFVVRMLINRFKEKKIILKQGGTYEFR